MSPSASPHLLSDSGLVATLRACAQRLTTQPGLRDRDALLGQLVVSAVELIPAAAGGGISRTHERDVRSSHATVQVVYELDQLQDRLGEGPCVDAADDPPPDGTQLARDFGGECRPRWPRFAPAAIEAGYRSLLSVTMMTERRHRAALNLYATEAHAFDDDAVATAGLFAHQAAALLYGADVAAQLDVALQSRDVIGRAKGILIERFAVTDAAAFAMLVESSQTTNMKLVAVASVASVASVAPKGSMGHVLAARLGARWRRPFRVRRGMATPAPGARSSGRSPRSGFTREPPRHPSEGLRCLFCCSGAATGGRSFG